MWGERRGGGGLGVFEVMEYGWGYLGGGPRWCWGRDWGMDGFRPTKDAADAGCEEVCGWQEVRAHVLAALGGGR